MATIEALSADSTDALFKILVVGYPGVGKTSIIRKYVQDTFSNNYKTTVGVDFALKTIEGEWKGSKLKKVKLQFWDIAGQEQYASTMITSYYKGAHGAFVVFDKERANTLEVAAEWMKTIDRLIVHDPRDPKPDFPVILLANKCDLPAEKFQHTADQINAFVQKNKFKEYFDTSASKGTGIDQAVRKLVEYILEREVQKTSTPPARDTVALGERSGRANSGGCC